jgi:hypothetical protein
MRNDRVYLMHIRDAARRIQDYSRDGREAFMTEWPSPNCQWNQPIPARSR